MNLVGIIISLSSFPYWTLAIFFIVSLVFLYSLLSYTNSKTTNKLEILIYQRTEELLREKSKAENLLTRVLPRDTADELKEYGKVNAQKFKMVTVLFSDIQGFTKITDEINAEELIDQLDKFFFRFDTVVDKYRIEKIKTIGRCLS